MQSDSGHTVSLWMDTVDMPRYPKLAGDAECDVCVVGAGIAGMMTAYLLAKEGRRVLVVDDGEIGGGETGRTTAHIAPELDDRYFAIAKMHGEEGARLAAESHRAAAECIDGIVEREGIDCDFTWLDGYLFLAPGDDPSILDRELVAAREAGLEGVELVVRAPVESFDTGPALRFPGHAQFHPLRFLAGLARAIVGNGGRIVTGTHVAEVEGRPRRPRVTTADKHTVTADAVVVATNSPISDYVVTHAKMAPYRTFVIGARVPSGSVPTILLWDTPDPYHYVRIQPNGDHDVLLVGGEDHKTGQADDADERFRRLEHWTRERFPTVESVDYRWSGQVMEPSDYLGFIGPNPDGAPNVYIATGDSGNGMTHGAIAGMLLRDLILERPNAWAALYDPKRVSLRAAPELAKENLNVAAQYVKDYLSPGEVPSADDIAPGTGKVIRRGTHKIAAYRDDRGQLHERSAVCPHLKCIVDWNSTEKSWDCPCHGSRFDPYGKVLNGPALTELGEVG